MIVFKKIETDVNFASRRATAESIVRELFGCGIIRDQHGAPSLENKKVHISISHTENIVCVAYSDNEIGVDVERIDRKIEKLSKRFASVDEIEICRAVFAENPALLVWCVKEAIYKTLHRSGIDFLNDMKILSASDTHQICATGDSKPVNLEWKIEGDLLIVYTV